MKVKLQFCGSFMATCEKFLRFSGKSSESSICECSKFKQNWFSFIQPLRQNKVIFCQKIFNWKKFFALLKFSNKTNYCGNCGNVATKQFFVELFQKANCQTKLIFVEVPQKYKFLLTFSNTSIFCENGQQKFFCGNFQKKIIVDIFQQSKDL